MRGCETAGYLTFAERGDMSLLGPRTLEGFGVTVDSIGHHFTTRATIVARRTDGGNRSGYRIRNAPCADF